MQSADLDIILFGATGVTGKMTAAHLVPFCLERGIRIGLAGRSISGLEQILDEIGAPADIPLILASSSDPKSLSAMAGRTACVLSTVGPYQLYGSELVKACVESGTDYLDVNGEPAWMAEMIEAYERHARSSGARILFSCGFDSVPFDLGVFYLQNQAIEQNGAPYTHVFSRVRMRGRASEGSARTNAASSHAVSQSVAAASLQANPYALIPGYEGVAQPDLQQVRLDERSDTWLAPFIMAPINSKSVHRTNYLLNYRYGVAFTYDEMFAVGVGDQARRNAERLSNAGDIVDYLETISHTVPSDDDRTGFYEIHVSGTGAAGEGQIARVRADHDPGYESTARIATQVASLLMETPRSSLSGGIWTPTAAFGEYLVEKLNTRTGITIALLDC